MPIPRSIGISSFSLPNACPQNNMVFDIYYNSVSAPNLIFSNIPFSTLQNFNTSVPDGTTQLFFSSNCLFCPVFSTRLAEIDGAYSGNSTSSIDCLNPFFIYIDLANYTTGNLSPGTIIYSDESLSIPLINTPYLVRLVETFIPQQLYLMNTSTGAIISYIGPYTC